MRTLLAKIETDAAKRLPLPPGRRPADELPRYQSFLKIGAARLKMLHRAGWSGRDISRARAEVLDALHRHIFAATRALLPAEAQRALPAMALVAIGGYGRGELNPHSDIDLMLLHAGDAVATARGQAHPFLKALTEPGGLLYTLFDLGLKVGYSVRTVDDCVAAANENMQSKTSLIEARLITGDEALFKNLLSVLLVRCVRGREADYIAARVADQASRRKKFGNSACMQEPNLKNGCGGLRDYQNLLWMAFFKHRTRTLADLEAKEMINATERRQLESAYDFLLRVRNELHYHSGRSGDVLTKSVQPAVASNLGYGDRAPSVRLERFMRDYYVHARNIDLITRYVEQRLALIPKPIRLPLLGKFLARRRKAAEQTVDGFRIVNGELLPLTPRVFKEDPRRLMRVFLYLQQRNLKLHPDTAQLLRNETRLVDGAFGRDPHVHETFLEILGQRGNVAGILRTMHEVDFLGKFLPEFGRLTCLVQHEFFHIYTADEHTLVCLQKLDDIWTGAQPNTAEYQGLMQKLERPATLYLALLMHDAGKAMSGRKHTVTGAELAVRVARRLRLEPGQGDALRLLVEHHLTMVQISQRRDLDDPAVIRRLAGIVPTPELLNALTLHTLADSLGTSDQLWNGFKDALLWTLYRKTHAVVSGEGAQVRADEKQRETLAREVRRQLPRDVQEDEVEGHFATLPARYFLTQTAKDITADLALAHRFLQNQVGEDGAEGLAPVIEWLDEPDRGCTRVKVCTWDRAGLFSKIAGSFTAAGMNILSAQIFSREDGLILDTFHVVTSRTGTLPGPQERSAFDQFLLKSLTATVDFDALLRRQKVSNPLYQSFEGERLATEIHFDNETSENRTVIDLQTEDRVGLLYAVSHVFGELGLDLSLAKVSTERGAVMDSFYVSEVRGRRVESPTRRQAIEARLRSAILNLDAAGR